MNNVYRVKKNYEMKRVDKRSKKLKNRETNRKLRERLQKFKSYQFIVEGIVLDAGTGVGVDLLALSSFTENVALVGIGISMVALKSWKQRVK